MFFSHTHFRRCLVLTCVSCFNLILIINLINHEIIDKSLKTMKQKKNTMRTNQKHTKHETQKI